VSVASTQLAVRAAEPLTRKVYVTVVDKQGQPVPDLTPADFTLKEGGREREITAASPATEKLRVSLMVEETLTPLGGIRQGLADFMQKMAQTAEMELVVVGLSNRVAVPYTSDLNALIGGINALPLSQRQQTNHVPEGIYETARKFATARTERPVIVMIALNSQQASSEQPQNVLNHLRDSNAQLHVVSIDTAQQAGNPAEMLEMSGRAQVLGDGPKQSGGRQHPVNALTAVPKAMLAIANDLSSQYVLTYVLPDGVRPSDRLSVELEKRGFTLRAPTRISGN
jgi:VWFA-related protein